MTTTPTPEAVEALAMAIYCHSPDDEMPVGLIREMAAKACIERLYSLGYTITRAEPSAPSSDEVEREICSMRKTIAVAGKHPDFVVRIDILKSILDARDNSNFLEKEMWSALAFLIADDVKAAKNTLDDALVKINLSHKGE